MKQSTAISALSAAGLLMVLVNVAWTDTLAPLSYTYAPGTQPFSYGDTGKKLTDGILGPAANFTDTAWVGFNNTVGKFPVQVTFTFATGVDCSQIQIVALNNPSSGIYPLKKFTVSFSADGRNYSGDQTFNTTAKEQEGNPVVINLTRDVEGSGRYLRLSMDIAPASGYLFLSEVTFQGVPNATAVDTSLTASPEPLLKNGSFEEWDGGKPVGWTVGEGTYEPDYVNKIDGAVALRTKVDVHQKVPPGYLHNSVSQILSLKPNTAYRLSVYAAKDATGVYRLCVHSVAGGKPDKEILVMSQWVWGFPYTCFTKEFKTQAASEYMVSLSQYGNASAWTYFDKVKIEEVRSGDLVPGRSSTMDLYEQSVMWTVEGERLGPGAQVLKLVSLILTRGETEARTVILQTGEKEMRKVLLKTAGPLIADGGSKINASALSVRSIRNGVLLPLARSEDVEAHYLAYWQVFVKTNSDTLPGRYTGQLVLEGDGSEIRTIPITVEVLDLILPPARISFGIYHNTGYFPEAFISESYTAKVFQDMKEHGMNTLSVYNNPEAADGQCDLSHDNTYDVALIPDKFRNDPKAQADPSETYRISRWRKLYELGLEKTMPLAQAAGLISKEHPVMWLVSKLGTYTFGGINPATLKKALREWQRRGWPEPLLYVVDEPGALPEREQEALFYLKRLEETGVKIRTVTAGPDPDRILGEKYDVWVLDLSKINYHNFEQAVRKNKGFWMYDCAVQNNNPRFARAMYGFSAYASRVSGVWQ